MKPKKRSFWRYKKLYCWPNWFGFLGFALFIVILAAGATYQNNLVFMMAFVCLSFALVAILQTARNIRDISLLSLQVEPHFAGETTTAEMILKNNSAEMKFNIELKVVWEGTDISFYLPEIHAHSTASVKATVQLDQTRGVYKIDRVRVATVYPYGLFNTWLFLPCTDEIYIYPKPFGKDLNAKNNLQSGEDFSGHKSYEPGDSQNRLDWKIYSKTNQLFVKQFNESPKSQCQILWDDIDDDGLDAKLSQMSQWITQAEIKSMRYEVVMPRFYSGLGDGKNHYQKCMNELARKSEI